MPASPLKPSPQTGSFTADAFAAHLASLTGAPDWWLDRKRAAYEKFASLPMPRRTDESWRFSSIGTLTLDGFCTCRRRRIGDLEFPALACPAPPPSPSSTTASSPLRGPRAELAAKGVIVTTLAEAVVKHADLLKAHFMAQPQKLGSEKFAALHTAFLGDGAFIYVPRGVEVDAPIVVTHAAAGAGAAVFPHTLVIAEENSKVTVVDYFVSADDPAASAIRRRRERSLCRARREADLRCGAKLVAGNALFPVQLHRRPPRCPRAVAQPAPRCAPGPA